MINANEVGNDVVFSLSGSFNTASASDSGIVSPAPGPGEIEPNTPLLKFSTSGAAGSVIIWTLPNISGPSAFGSGSFLPADSGASNSNLEFSPFIKGGGTLNLYTSYVSGTSLSDVMTFSGQSFSSLGITPGSYVWSWPNGSVSDNLTLQIGPSYSAQVQQPINADRSSVFNVHRGVVPVKFTLTQGGVATCALPPATIALTRTDGGTIGAIDEYVYSGSADTGSNFRIDSCQYVYNLSTGALGPGTYRVEISIGGSVVGSGTFGLK